MGIHNEPGLREIEPMPPVEELVTDMLRYCLDARDQDRAFVEFRPDDTILLLINNFGGMSNFEIEALSTITQRVLKSKWHIAPVRQFVQCFETSLNAPGWSISLLNLSGVQRTTSTDISTLLTILDADTTAPAWPKNGDRAITQTSQDDARGTKPRDHNSDSDIRVDGARLEQALRKACDAAIQAEPDLTKWDIEMGDGDCGEAVVGMCQGVLNKLDQGLAKDGRLFKILDEVEEAIEEIGGTLGAIISIVVASFTTNLRQALKEQGSQPIGAKALGTAAGAALRNLMGYTSARTGGRTVMDALIPFCETFEREGNLDEATRAAETGAETTAGMAAKFGRGEYQMTNVIARAC